MNILMISYSANPNKGGVERVSALLAKEFTARGHCCYVAYSHESDARESWSDSYKGYHHVDITGDLDNTAAALKEIIISNNIEFVINHLCLEEWVLQAAKRILPVDGVRFVTVCHMSPGSYMQIMRAGLRSFRVYPVIFWKSLFRIIISPFYKRGYKRVKVFYEVSDRMVVLSEKAIKEFVGYYKVKDVSKLVCINNPAAVFKEPYDVDKLDDKKNTVLIVARLSEVDKRLSSALRVWKIVEERNYAEGWELKIVGSGRDERLYRDMINKLGLRSVSMCGHSDDPEEYYNEASLFMMTSCSEGWPMTLMEAQQKAVVPLAFDSYSASSEIIMTGENGVIIKDRDHEAFAEALKGLMENKTERHRLARNAVKSIERFSIDEIADSWMKLIDHI